MLDLLQYQNSQLNPNEQPMLLEESEICEQVLRKRFSYIDQQKKPKEEKVGNL